MEICCIPTFIKQISKKSDLTNSFQALVAVMECISPVQRGARHGFERDFQSLAVDISEFCSLL